MPINQQKKDALKRASFLYACIFQKRIAYNRPMTYTGNTVLRKQDYGLPLVPVAIY